MAIPRIFVSHSHKDDAFTQRLVSDLRLAGAQVWVDISDIMANDFMDRINQAVWMGAATAAALAQYLAVR